jgi:hypothetical protein
MDEGGKAGNEGSDKKFQKRLEVMKSFVCKCIPFQDHLYLKVEDKGGINLAYMPTQFLNCAGRYMMRKQID